MEPQNKKKQHLTGFIKSTLKSIDYQFKIKNNQYDQYGSDQAKNPHHCNGMSHWVGTSAKWVEGQM